MAERFRLERILGRGGFGEVWSAFDTVTGKPAAVKRLLPEARAVPEAFARFAREAKLQARVAHPNLVKVLASDLEAPAPWLAMELVEGADLAKTLKEQGPLPPARVLALARELAGALDALHDAGVLHRDLKPANVMLAAGTGRAVLMDLGLAGVVDATVLTRTGQIMGSPAYLPPEAMDGETWTGAGDLYQLGAVLFEAATGERLAEGKLLDEVVASIRMGRQTPFRAGTPVPPPMQAAIRRAAAHDAARRFHRGEHLVAAMEGRVHPGDPGDPGEGEGSSARPVVVGLASGALRTVGSGLTSELGTGARGAGSTGVAGSAPGIPPGPWRLALGLVVLAALGAALPWSRPEPPRELAWTVAGDVLVASWRGMGSARLAVDGVEAGTEALPDGRFRAVYRSLPADREVSARLVWEGGQGEAAGFRADRPAVGTALRLAGSGAVEVDLAREVEVGIRGAPGGRKAAGPGGARLAIPDPLPGELEVEWVEAGVEFSRKVVRSEVLGATVARLERDLAGYDPAPVYRDRAVRKDKSGEGFAEPRAHWKPLVAWLPSLLSGGLPGDQRRRLFQLWQEWQWTEAAERYLGGGPDLPTVLPGLPGSRFQGQHPASVGRIELELTPRDGVEPWEFKPDKRLVMIPASTRNTAPSGRWVEGATRATAAWPAGVPVRGTTVCLELESARLPVHLQARLTGPGLEVRWWHPDPKLPEPDDAKGPMSVCLPADLGPGAGTPLLLEVVPLTVEAANFARITGLAVTWGGPDPSEAW